MSIETLKDLWKDLGLPEDTTNATLETLLAGESSQIRDARMNLSALSRSKELTAKEQALLAVAVANNNNNHLLERAFSQRAKTEGATDAELASVLACTSVMRSNNILYRFRHFIGKESYESMPAGLRMNVMMNPAVGKEFFELVSTAISAVNGCEACVKSHEASLLHLGCTEKRIFEAIRVACIITSLGTIVY